MIREIIDALVTVTFWLTLAVSGKEAYLFMKTETTKILQRGQNDLSDFNRSLTKKHYDWEK